MSEFKRNIGNQTSATDLGQHLDAYAKMRNSIIEECARAAEKAWPPAHTYASENADLYRGQDHAVRTAVKAIRELNQESP